MKSKLTIIAAISAILSLFPTIAVAQGGNDNSHGGGDSGGSNLGGPYSWNVVASHKQGEAWNAFISKNGWGNLTERRLADAHVTGEVRRTCENAEMIFWTKSDPDSRQRWSYNAHGGQRDEAITTDSFFKPVGQGSTRYPFTYPDGRTKTVSNYFNNKILNANKHQVANGFIPTDRKIERFFYLDYLPQATANLTPSYAESYRLYREAQKRHGEDKVAAVVFKEESAFRRVVGDKAYREAVEWYERNSGLDYTFNNLKDFIKNTYVGEGFDTNNYPNSIENHHKWHIRKNIICSFPPPVHRVCAAKNLDGTQYKVKFPGERTPEALYWKLDENGQIWENRPFNHLDVASRIYVRPENPTKDIDNINDEIQGIGRYTIEYDHPDCIVGPRICAVNNKAGQQVEHPIHKRAWYAKLKEDGSLWVPNKPIEEQIFVDPHNPRQDEDNTNDTIEGIGRYLVDKNNPLCVSEGTPPPPVREDPPEHTPFVPPQGGETLTFIYPYSKETTVTKAYGGQSGHNFNDQTSGEVITEYGKLVDAAHPLKPVVTLSEANPARTYDSPDRSQEILDRYKKAPLNDYYKKIIEDARNVDRGRPGPTVDLSNTNKHVLANGAVFNIDEHTKWAQITIRRELKITKKTLSKQVCTQHNPQTGLCEAYKTLSKEVLDRVTETTYVERSPMTAINSSRKVTGHHQILTAHCNKPGIDNLIAKNPSLTVNHTSPEGRGISTTLTTQPIVLANDDKPISKDLRPFPLLLGQNSLNPETGSLDFYSKECPFVCKADDNAPTANTNNGAKENIRAKEHDTAGEILTREGTQYGAQVGQYHDPSNPAPAIDPINSNAITFHRDNAKRVIRPDVWYPETNSTVKYNGQAAVTTTVARWEKGTPAIEYKQGDGKGGEFEMYSLGTGNSNPIPMFKGNNPIIPKQWNWNATPFSNNILEILPGQHNAFTVQATWPSEAEFPQVFNFKWEYAPDVGNLAPISNFGYGSTNSGRPRNTSALQEITSPIQGKCYAEFGKDSGKNTVNEFFHNTGVNTPNNLDNRLRGGEPSSPRHNEDNLTVRFVRGISES